jgi:hypothetical protein
VSRQDRLRGLALRFVQGGQAPPPPTPLDLATRAATTVEAVRAAPDADAAFEALGPSPALVADLDRRVADALNAALALEADLTTAQAEATAVEAALARGVAMVRDRAQQGAVPKPWLDRLDALRGARRDHVARLRDLVPQLLDAGWALRGAIADRRRAAGLAADDAIGLALRELSRLYGFLVTRGIDLDRLAPLDQQIQAAVREDDVAAVHAACRRYLLTALDLAYPEEDRP